MDDSAPTLVNELVARAEKAGASDVHLQMIGGRAEVSFRIDGVLTHATCFPEDVAERVVGRIKFLARLKTYQESMPQDGRIEKQEVGTKADIRVATYPTVTGEKLVLRLFNSQSVRTLEELEFPESLVGDLKTMLRQTAGLLLLTGPAGSGKTTTIYACLKHLMSNGGRHIITVEDPVEQIFPGLMQTEVNEARDLTFAAAARHLLRQDPEVLVIGEIRDSDTATLAIRAALTGHLVISTLHAGSSRGVIDRLLSLCPDQYAVVSALQMIINQRLVRRCCCSCKGAGCDACLKTGYHGRVAIAEWKRIDDLSRKNLRQNIDSAIAIESNLQTEGCRLVASGLTTVAEMDRVLGR